ncbi:unnamed protein product [Peronospora farinosa]|uniref:Uncharacterized protein n=1 Tax=Peronospora farinosa TaxID=134698 RepID=A0AAV0TSV8_9STRA|nr:unnamed protein product [Peronospora farinosa]CAI5725689.1 unnamed protein product [Peronospora farinosa]
MASSSLSVEAVSAIEDAFLRGEWTQALHDSRSMLTARMVPVKYRCFYFLLERVLSVYLQIIFELNLDDEVETVVAIANMFTPLPSGIATQYCKFLIAMNRRLLAKEVLQDLLESFTVNGGMDISTEQYMKVAETMALHLLLPEEGIQAAQLFVAEDKMLDDEVKLQLLYRIQTMHLAAQEAENKDSMQTSSVDQTVKNASGNPHVPDATYQQSVSTAFTNTQQAVTKQDDNSSCYVVIGTTAIVLAAATAGVLRYREKIHEYISNAIPAISKGVADAKFAIFEA